MGKVSSWKPAPSVSTEEGGSRVRPVNWKSFEVIETELD